MNFLTPLALTFAALSIPIILLYMLKLRRQDVLVSSTLLWQRLLRDREANAPWQRLRRNLLLLLQLLILALLTLALARPFIPTPTVVVGSVVILLDASASMQAADVAPMRFDAGIRAAQDIVAGLGTGDVATIIAVGPQPQVLASSVSASDRSRLRRALDDAVPTNGPHLPLPNPGQLPGATVSANSCFSPPDSLAQRPRSRASGRPQSQRSANLSCELAPSRSPTQRPSPGAEHHCTGGAIPG